MATCNPIVRIIAVTLSLGYIYRCEKSVPHSHSAHVLLCLFLGVIARFGAGAAKAAI